MPKKFPDSPSVVLLSPTVPPGGSQGTQKSPGHTACSGCTLGRRCSPRVLHCGALETLKLGEGRALPGGYLPPSPHS